MSPVVIPNSVVYLADQVPDTAHASITQQATEIITRIDKRLGSVGSTRTRLLIANTWLSDATTNSTACGILLPRTCADVCLRAGTTD